VSEKQEKTKEYLKIMTLSESAYLQGQLLTHYLIGSIGFIIISLTVYSVSYLEEFVKLKIILSFIFFIIASTH
jgi:hypothetical protein